MNAPFDNRLKSLIANMPAEFRSQVRRDLRVLAKRRIESFGDLTQTIKNQTAAPKLRRIACWVIARLGNKAAVYALLTAFNDPDSDLVQEAAVSLGVLGNRRAVKPLIAALQEFASDERRYIAAYALGLLGDERAVNPLLSILNDKKDNQKVRGQAAEALAMIGDRRAIPSLMQALNDSSAEVRFWSIFALGQMRATEAIPKLRRLAATDKGRVKGWWSVAREAKDAIKAIEPASTDSEH